MNLYKKVFASILGASLLFCQGAFADDKQKEEGQKQEQSAKSKDLKQVEGTVVQHKFVNVFKDKQAMEQAEKSGNVDKASEKKMLVVMLQTAKGNERLMVDLGPMQEAPKIKDGETKLQVEGKMINIGSKELFVAKRAKIDGNMLKINRKSS